ncbi:MAG: PSD1 domain-containing protein [Planctomycetaceae bacterium]|nr:PSD1 domain-containing protein [Planctomycetaceae bacterium]
MMRLTSFSLLFIASVCTAADESTVSFERDVRPLLKAACFHCHGEGGMQESGLDVRLARLMQTGGDSGPAIVPGDSENSLLFQRVRDGEMPPEASHRLTEAQIATIGRWIDAGAPTLRPEPEAIDGFLITEEERSHWSFQPIEQPSLPRVEHADQLRTPIDAFLLAKLEAQGFTFAEDAPSASLLRRVMFDLVGLPPTPEQVERFIGDESAEAYEHLIDELLASPHYGERWGRHWLDIAGYADSEGYNLTDAQRPHAWRYRDYVIRAFNDDKPFDRFVLEQLAGDELITSPFDNLSDEDAELLTATGFLRMAPDGTGGSVDDANVARNDVVAETVKIVTSSLMGLTVGCAQCHDHRYDPIPQADYYRLRAVFDPALDWTNWKAPNQRLVSLYTDADRAKAAEIEAEAKKIDAERTEKQNVFIAATFEKELAKLPEEIQPTARAAHDTPEKERTDEQIALLKEHPSLNITSGSLYLYDQKAADELKALADKAQAIRDTKPEERFVRALTETPGQVPVSHLFARGDHEQPKQELEPAGLSIVSTNVPVPEVPMDDEVLPTTGRRTAFAKRITDPNHPLLARVIVNRIWLHHFGRGLVSTPADFGTLGTPPTHPELLDWLASEFIDSGWSVKHIHRLILTSTAYRQALHADGTLLEADPDNLLYGRANLRRLDAESLRDAVLIVSGKLNDKSYGPAVTVIADRVGRWVLGIENLSAGRPGDVLPLHGEDLRRSVYVEVRRTRPLAVLDTFDWPRMAPNCDVRRTSTVAPQSLMLMNSDFVLDYAGQFARRVEAEAGSDPEARINRAWQLAFCRSPDQSEQASARTFLETQTATFQEVLTPPKENAQPTEPTAEQRALETLCQMLLSSNEFLYID